MVRKKHSISPCFDAKRSFQLGNQNTVGSSCSSLFGGKYFIFFFRAQIFKLESERDRKLTFIILLVDGGDFFRVQIFQTQPAKKFKNQEGIFSSRKFFKHSPPKKKKKKIQKQKNVFFLLLFSYFLYKILVRVDLIFLVFYHFYNSKKGGRVASPTADAAPPFGVYTNEQEETFLEVFQLFLAKRKANNFFRFSSRRDERDKKRKKFEAVKKAG